MVATNEETRSLLEDWQLRRQRLLLSETIPVGYRQVQLRVLDYLIGRYADSPDAARRARSPEPAEFYSDDRAIVVHHHLGQGKIAGVKNPFEASRRMADILDHLRQVREKDEATIAAHNDFAAWIDELEDRPGPTSAWHDIWRQFTQVTPPRRYAEIAKALEHNPYLPRPVLAFLSRRLSQSPNDETAADLLLACCSEDVARYVARAWRERVSQGWHDCLTARFHNYLAHQPSALDDIRERMADRNPMVRLAAIELLRKGGTLDDVALLSDLVSLPSTADEHPGERRALLDAMWAIAHR